MTQVHTFDPTVDPAALSALAAAGGYTAHSVGLGSLSESAAHATLVHGPLRTLREIMADAGHAGRALTVLKVDCEGCEWQTLVDQVFVPMRDGQLTLGQLQVELHFLGMNAAAPLREVKAFFEAADAAGMRVFHKERNHWGCNGYMVSQSGGCCSQHVTACANAHKT